MNVENGFNNKKKIEEVEKRCVMRRLKYRRIPYIIDDYTKPYFSDKY